MRVTPDNSADDLKTVRLLQVPLAAQVRSTQHFDELIREFALISMDTDRARPSTDTARPVPVRLLALVDELNASYATFTAAVTAERDEAVARGETEIDLTYDLPASVVAACHELGTLLDEVDDYCRSGQHLITLATSPESLALRKWYLGEFPAQIEEGRAPLAWPDYVADHHPDADWSQS